MHQIPPYDDDYDCLTSDYSLFQPSWYGLDPNLYQRPAPTTPQYFTTYNQSAHGFAYIQPPQRSPESIYQLGLPVTWQYEIPGRHVRHISPSASGASMSSADSAFGDYALSPDMARSSQTLLSYARSPDAYGSPAHEFSTGHFSPSFHQPSAQVTLTAHPFLSSHTASMREVQYAPDSHMDDESHAMHERDDTIKVPAMHIPEELELSGESSPADSGLGQSIDDNAGAKDEPENNLLVSHDDSDNDSEFTPTRTVRKSTVTPLRASLRSPRRPTALSNTTVLDPSSRIHKSKVSTNSKVKTKPKSKSYSRNNSNNQPPKSFPCTFHHYGCPSTFACKNEWKRHVASQHLQLGFYRCDMDSCAPRNSVSSASSHHGRGPNDFNRKDLFTQHCRRMHAPWGSKDPKTVSKRELEAFEEKMEGIRARCWSVRRQAPTRTACGVCGKKFSTSEVGSQKAWEERMEHVGRHYERDGVEKEKEAVDEGLKEWAVNEGVVRKGRKGGWWIVGLEPAAEREEFNGVRKRGLRRAVETRAKVPIQDEADRDDEEVEDIPEPSKSNEGDDDQDEDDDTDAEGEDE